MNELVLFRDRLPGVEGVVSAETNLESLECKFVVFRESSPKICFLAETSTSSPSSNWSSFAKEKEIALERLWVFLSELLPAEDVRAVSRLSL